MHRLKGLQDLATHPSAVHGIELLGLVAVVAAVVYLLFHLAPSTIVALGVGAEVFSGNWRYMHVPLPLDRLLLTFGFLALAFRGVRNVSPERRLLFSPLHLLMLSLVVYATLSALWAGTLSTSLGLYAILDRLGVIPFLLFTTAPLLFGSERGRRTLLAVLVAVGLYLGFTALLEGVGLTRLTLPSYIHNPTVGIHFGRARGPFVESVADGLSMFMCGVAAAVALTSWRQRWARAVCYATILLTGAGILFTVTRSVWIGAVGGVLVAMAFDPRLRRRLPSALLALVVVTMALLVLVPGLKDKAGSRANNAATTWDRYNTNHAAVLAWTSHPIFGIGWESFVTAGPDYLRQAGTYPQTGQGLEVHNVFLSHLVELGLIGAVMWTATVVFGVGGAALRRGPPELYAWRLGLVAIATCFLVVANLGPLSYPFPNLLLWLWAGIVASDRYSTTRSRSSGNTGAAATRSEDAAGVPAGL